MKAWQVALMVALSWLLAAWPVVPWAVAAGVAVGGSAGLLVSRHPMALLVVVVAGVACHSDIQARPDQAMAAGQRIEASASLVSDPVRRVGMATALADIEGTRMELRASGGMASTLAPMLAGERFFVRGRVRELPEGVAWLRARHVSGRLEVSELSDWRPASNIAGMANRYRSLLWRGSASLPDDRRALFTGFVFGDDRAQSALVADAFAGAGLTHLTAVSGQNVAFVLAVLAPLLRRLWLGWRLVVVLAALVAFAVLTRAEPSVLRAVVMSGLAAGAAFLGRPTSGLRNLGLAVAALLVVDPMLSIRPAFGLSVAASAGILVAAGPISARLAGPPPLRLVAGVTVAAQLATGPLLGLLFGGSPLAAFPANLLAEPAAGLLMMWGLTGGTLAGLAAAVGWGDVAALLHVPSRVLLWWVDGVAARLASAPVGRLGVVGSILLAGGVALLLSARWLSDAWRRWRAAASRSESGPEPDHDYGHEHESARGVGTALVRSIAIAALLAGLIPALAGPWRSGPPLDGVEVGSGTTIWRSADGPRREAGLLVVDGRSTVRSILARSRDEGITSIDVVVLGTSSPTAIETVAVVGERLSIGAVIGPAGLDANQVAESIGWLPHEALWLVDERSDVVEVDVRGMEVLISSVDADRLEVDARLVVDANLTAFGADLRSDVRSCDSCPVR